jgi:nucleoside-diphosphate-sugar epimerase
MLIFAMARTAFVTGARGFVGQGLVEVLVRDGWNVRALSRPGADNTFLAATGAQIIDGYITDWRSLLHGVAGADVIFHLAGITRALYPREFYRVNHGGSIALAHACLQASPFPGKLIVLSSLAAGGPSRLDRPRTEDDPDTPLTPYGRSKHAGEKALVSLLEGRLPVSVLRPPGIYGPRDRDYLEFFKMVRSRLTFTVGLRDRAMSMVYVDDVINAMLRMADISIPHGRFYYLSDGEYHSWEQLARMAGELLGKKPLVIRLPSPLGTVVGEISEMWGRFIKKPLAYNRVRATKARQRAWTCRSNYMSEELGFTPAVELKVGLSITMRWYLEHGWL